MNEKLYTYRDLEAAFQVGYSRGVSDRRRGPRSGDCAVGKKVVDLVLWLRDVAGRPCSVNPDEVCASTGVCLEGAHDHEGVQG